MAALRSDVAALVMTDAIAKPLLVLMLAIGLPPMVCHADVTKLAGADRRRLERPGAFHEVHAVTDLPAAVVALCADGNGRLAEPGARWEVGDYISDPALPRKRLIWAATDGTYYVVHYEIGGRAHSFLVLVATMASPGA